MPPSRRVRGDSSIEEGLSVVDNEWISRHGAKDVACALDVMQTAIRAGRLMEARAAGQEASIPLSLSAADLHLQERISEGAESIVWRGKLQGMDVAAKKFKIMSSQDLWRFRKELLLLSSFNHPNIVPILGAKAFPPDYTLVLPLCSTNLQHKLYHQGWRPTWAEVTRIGCELASALCHIHEKGVVHRDIKPANMLVSHPGGAMSSGLVQLADFGTAELEHKLLEAAMDTSGKYKLGHKPSGGFHKRLLAGTLEYMAPEVLLKEPQTLAADVYAAAVTINELIMGTFPYSDCTKENPDCHTVLEMGYNRQELATAVVGAGLRPILPKNSPPGYRELMEACWQLNPADRPSAETLLTALQNIDASLLSWRPYHVLSLKTKTLHHSGSVASFRSWTLASANDICPVDKCSEMDTCSMDGEHADPEESVSLTDDTCSMPDLDGLSNTTTSEQEVVVDCVGERMNFEGGSSSTSNSAGCPAGPSHPRPVCKPAAAPSHASETAAHPDVVLDKVAHSDVVLDKAAHGDVCDVSGMSVAEVRADAMAWLSAEGQGAYQPQLSAGVFDTAGAREKMEDRSLVAPCFAGMGHVHLYGVFDGHRGHAAADFVVEHLPASLTHALAGAQKRYAGISSDAGTCTPAYSPASYTDLSDSDGDMQFERSSSAGTVSADTIDGGIVGADVAADSGNVPVVASGAIPAALEQAFLALDRQFAEEQDQRWRSRISRMGLFAAGRRPYPGCTALTAILVGNTLFTANAGDCRAVLGRGGKAIQLNREHNADCEDERLRVQREGGEVFRARDGWRVGASQIQVTRSIGDLDEKRAGVSALPEVTRIELTEDDEFLIIGSDGLWEHIGNEEAVGMVMDTVKEPYMCGKRLATEAMVRGSKDNITAMVVFLRPVSTLERVFAHGVATHEFTATEYSSRS